MIRNKLNYFLLSGLMLACQFGIAQTTRLTNFDQLMQSLNSGEKVRVVIHFGLCQWALSQNKQTPTPKAVTGMDIDTYEYFPAGAVHNSKAFVVFSNTKLIQNPIGKGFVLNYGKVRINEDNTVQVTAKYLHAKNHKELMSEVFVGKLNDGNNNEGINLFK
jgi:hypothetical protein